MNIYRGVVEIQEHNGNRVRLPVEQVKASSWHIAMQRATALALRMYRKNRKGQKSRILAVTTGLNHIGTEIRTPANFN